jgi:hypothetical protein
MHRNIPPEFHFSRHDRIFANPSCQSLVASEDQFPPIGNGDPLRFGITPIMN